MNTEQIEYKTKEKTVLVTKHGGIPIYKTGSQYSIGFGTQKIFTQGFWDSVNRIIDLRAKSCQK